MSGRPGSSPRKGHTSDLKVSRLRLSGERRDRLSYLSSDGIANGWLMETPVKLSHYSLHCILRKSCVSEWPMEEQFYFMNAGYGVLFSQYLTQMSRILLISRSSFVPRCLSHISFENSLLCRECYDVRCFREEKMIQTVSRYSMKTAVQKAYGLFEFTTLSLSTL